ncbi:flavin reductase family protein, partial [Nocardia sp. NPDC058666]|uniref:flavin reductase family protein n=2 Tax=Actinomycetes TaxID=1760 RepID=UPI0036512A1B
PRKAQQMHVVPGLKVLYFGTPVVLISSRNEDGTANLAPMSSAWWLGRYCMLGLGNNARTTANLLREGECVLNLPSSAMADAVDRIALTTGKPDMPDYKTKQGYRYEPDKFAAAGLTEQASDLVRAPRVAECPVQLECRTVSAHPFGGGDTDATAFQVEVLRAHVDEELVIPGTHYMDPVGWDPLIMKFCEFFGGGTSLRPSKLAKGWNMPHRATDRVTR